MEFELITYLIVCPLVFLAGIIDAIAGGGGLISLPAYIFAGLPPHFALGTNKLSSTIGTVIAVFRYYKNGFIDISICLLSIITALIGSALGAILVLYASEDILKKLLIFLLPAIAVYIFKNKNFNLKTNSYSRKTTSLYSAIISFFIGAYDGFFGPGTGTFLTLAFIAISKIDPKTAAGNAKVINLSSNIAGLSVFLYNDCVMVYLGLAAAVCSVVGNYVGAGLAINKGSNIIRYAILLVLALLFIKLALDLI